MDTIPHKKNQASAEDNACHDTHGYDRNKESHVIRSTNASIKPHAMMIKAVAAFVAFSTMLGSAPHWNVTFLTMPFVFA